MINYRKQEEHASNKEGILSNYAKKKGHPRKVERRVGVQKSQKRTKNGNKIG